MTIANVHTSARPLHLLAAARAIYGSTLVVAPRSILRLLGRENPHRGAVVFARVLGTRQLLETALLELHGSEAWIATGAAVDAVHAVTALALAGLRDDAGGTHDLLANAAVAAVLTAEGVRLARRR